MASIESGNKASLNILAIGNSSTDAIGDNTRVINPLLHPRVFLTNFMVGEKLLQYALKKVIGNKIFPLEPSLVAHLMKKTEGGLLIMIEARAFKELALVVGTRNTVV
ncbi:MAG: hypothetical protein COA75_03855 [Cellvibrionales bacterium]|nr:MAG: hypothetical protein COA75_03855 [Cellvibrionales bacterium]